MSQKKSSSRELTIDLDDDDDDYIDLGSDDDFDNMENDHNFSLAEFFAAAARRAGARNGPKPTF